MQCNDWRLEINARTKHNLACTLGLKQVLQPINQDIEGHFQRYDWEKDDLAEWHTVPIGGIVIIEGIYSIRRELLDKYDLQFGLIDQENYGFREVRKETEKKLVIHGKMIG
jgi:hypothetical protein